MKNQEGEAQQVNGEVKEGGQKEEVEVQKKMDTKSYELCDSCFKQGNYPTNDGTTEADFIVKSLPDHHWEKLSKELTQELENLAKAKPNSHLSSER